MRHAHVAGLAILLVAAACASNAEPPASVAPPGCYYPERNAAAAVLDLPWGVELLSVQLAGWPALQQLEDVRQARTLTAAGTQDHPFGYWRPLAGGDSVEVGYPGGGAVLLELAVSADGRTLNGTGRALGDAQPIGAPREDTVVTPVVLNQARCPEGQQP
jgi:hypothetical protein